MRYQRLWNGADIYEHRRVYEQHFGSIPSGFHIHHKNGNRYDNNPDNLEVLSPSDHRKLHSKRYRRGDNGEWLKICRTCSVLKPLSEFYAMGHKSHRANCKPCQHQIINAYMRQKRANRKNLRSAEPVA